MEIIFLFGTVQAFFMSLLIFTKGNKSTGDYVLGSWMVFMGLHLLDYYFLSAGLSFKYPHLLGLGYCFPMLEGPFMFVYVLVIIDKTGRFKPSYFLHTLPFLLLTIYFLMDFYSLDAPDKLVYYRQQSVRMNAAVKISDLLNAFSGPVYVIWSLARLGKHTKNITEQFSYTEQINLNWLKYVLAGLGFVWITVIITITVRNYFPSIPYVWTNHPIYYALTAAVFFLGFFGIKQKAIYFDATGPSVKKEVTTLKNEIPGERYKKSGLNKKQASERLNKLLQYMNEKKPYLNGKLSIKDLSDPLDISVNNLSQVINEQTNMCFFDFVNKYRVEELKTRLADPVSKQFTLLAVAYDCGFNSKSSFNSIFKKSTGLTPSEYLKTINT